MKRAYATFLALILTVCAWVPAMALTAAPESRFKSNVRIPQQLIIGGNLNNTGFAGPNLILRPLGNTGSTLDTTIQWTTPAAARLYTVPDAGANASFVLTGAGVTPAAFPLAGITFTGTTFNTVLKALNSMGQATTVTIPDPGASTANVVLSAGTQTLAGTYTFSASPTITGGLTAANIQSGSAKRQVIQAKMCPAGGAVTVNGTTYFSNISFGRAGIVKRITYFTHVDPVSGTNTVKVLKNGAGGNTMLSSASVSLNGSTADVLQIGTLTATSGDLALAATDTVYCEYAAGTQGTVAKDVTAVVEFEPTDF